MKDVTVLIIHVKGNKEREKFIQRQLDKLGFPYHYILDGNISDLTPNILAQYFTDNGANIKFLLVRQNPILKEITGTLKDQIKALYNSQSFTGTTIIEINGNLPLVIKCRALKGE